MRKILLSLIAALGLLLVSSSAVFAGTDLSVNCTAIGSCSITPPSMPLYNEAGWFPGSTVTQKLSITNASSQNGFSAIQVANYTDTNNLGQMITVQVHQGSPVGPIIYSASSLVVFKNDGYFTLAPLSAGQTDDYYFVATMVTTAGNEYQGSMANFDLNAGLEITPILPTSGGNTGGGGDSGGSVAGATTQAQPPVCTALPPGSAPVVTITNVGNNTVTLSWTPVSPVTYYGLSFTRVSDGAQYGASNIGNGMTYTVTNLSGGANYTFQIFGVNDCAPGPMSGGATRNVPGPSITSRPLGNGGQVLGTTTETPTPTPSPLAVPSPSPLSQVLGATAEVCADWKMYIPWILLVTQCVLLFLFEYQFRNESGWTKYLLILVTTVVSIVLFYLLHECPCMKQWSWLAWLCKWYWLVAVLLSLLMRGFGYAFLDETTEREEEPKVKSSEK